MVFSSMTFLFAFLPVVVLVYALSPWQFKNAILLIASLLFYAWGEPKNILLMLLSIGVNYVFGRIIEVGRESKPSIRKWNLAFAIGWNVLMLGIFKYVAGISTVLHSWAPSLIPVAKIALPIGISFYTFQAISYLIDVYRGTTKAQNNLINFALYISMFPQLIAGPIVRYTDVEQQIKSRNVTLAGFGIGCEYFIRGMVKKVLLANLLGQMFVRIQELTGTQTSVITAWIGAILYTLQIYYDFSGYSDMAIGLGRMFGFRFPKNFDYPYIAASITEFWRRWHMTLGTWFREYVYIPLGGNRVTVAKHIRNLLIVWGLTGIWHGAGINFLLWGLYYGCLLIIEKYVIGSFLKKHRWIGHIWTLFAVVIGWMLFANTSFTSLGQYFQMLFGLGGTQFVNATTLYFIRTSLILLVLGILFSTPIPHKLNERLLVKLPKLSVVLHVFLFLLCIAALVYQSYNPFLYFRF